MLRQIKYSDLDAKLRGWNWELILEIMEIGYENKPAMLIVEINTGNINTTYLNQHGVILVITYDPKEDRVINITGADKPMGWATL